MSNNEPPRSIEVIGKGKCTCGAELLMGYEGEDMKPTVIHNLPVCELFLSIENPIKYLREISKRLKALANKPNN